MQSALKSLKSKKQSQGFTIVELLVVIVVIGILAGIVVVAYTSSKQEAAESKQASDEQSLKDAIILARANSGKTLYQITGNTESNLPCYGTGGGQNPSQTEPKNLSESSACWQNYYDALDEIGDAANTDLNDLKKGDSKGNPYGINENEGVDSGSPCTRDQIGFYSGHGTDGDYDVDIPFSLPQCL